ncbi:MFS transporter [Devosia sp. Leaf64]|uniref:MFS transporter n=1 Tax=Devosia sp. Leaf64 TaxID=1736229 RepID=UPI000714C221|nr:MFS transporter [Devosia sp. Leaf64]KQN72426.1 hypothetical protein ASE94_07905 [Devosia sp. Leaf64]
MALAQAQKADFSLPALVFAQALSTFNHSLLRSAMLALLTFRGLTAFGLGNEALIAISTVVIVLPYVLLSLPAGRLADRYSKTALVRAMMGLDVLIVSAGAIGFATGNTLLILVVLLFAGIQAALLGPAKFAILPELAGEDRLLNANGWMSATGTVAVMLGLTLGSFLALDSAGFWSMLFGAPALAALGWFASQRIEEVGPKAPALSLATAAFAGDFVDSFRKLSASTYLTWPLIGSCWFWFQGTALTALLPIYVSETGGPDQTASLLFLVTTVGVAVGALTASQLIRRFNPTVLIAGMLAVIILPMLDLALLPHGWDLWGIARVSNDLTLTSAGAGFFLVPLTAAIQRLTQAEERARFVGISHTLSGFAMCLGGVTIFVFPMTGLAAGQMFVVLSVPTGLIGALSLSATPMRRDRHVFSG